MLDAYLLGLRVGLRRWPVVLVLFIASAAAAMSAGAASWLWLRIAFDKSLVTRTLLTDLDMNVFVDLFAHHSGSFQMWLLAVAIAMLIFVVLGVWLNAAAVASVGEDIPVRECLRRGLKVYPTYFRLWVLVTLFNAAVVVAIVFVVHRLTRATAESPSEMAIYWLAAGGLLAGALWLLFSTTVHDHARIRSTVSGTGATRSLLWAVGFVARREPRALALAALLLGSTIAAWVVYQTVGMLITATSVPGVVLSLVWGQVLMLLRMLLRVWSLAAAMQLQHLGRGGTP